MGRFFVRRTLKSCALAIPRIKALVDQRNALLAERDQLIASRRGERDQLIESGRRVDELLISNAQLQHALSHMKGLPVPPRHLQERVVGGYFPAFLTSATRALGEFDDVLRSAGKELANFERVLDLGVGCGRVIRRFHELYPHASLTGADIDTEAISWLQQNYASVGRFVALPHLPPSGFADAEFDLIYAISVFTHIDEAMQFAWLGELRRIGRPGGYLLLTVHGANHHRRFPAEYQERIAAGFYYHAIGPLTEGLPEFYRTTMHTRVYVEREWSRYFDVLAYIEEGAEGHQDLILCRIR